MTDEGTKVTLRMGPEVIQMMEDFMDEHDIGNRSDFIRDAIKGYIDSQRNGGTVASGSGIFVRFSDLQMDALQGLVQRGGDFREVLGRAGAAHGFRDGKVGNALEGMQSVVADVVLQEGRRRGQQRDAERFDRFHHPGRIERIRQIDHRRSRERRERELNRKPVGVEQRQISDDPVAPAPENHAPERPQIAVDVAVGQLHRLRG